MNRLSRVAALMLASSNLFALDFDRLASLRLSQLPLGPAPAIPPAVPAAAAPRDFKAEIPAAIARGQAFLLPRQLPNGSWGTGSSGELAKYDNVYFRIAITAMAVSALDVPAAAAARAGGRRFTEASLNIQDPARFAPGDQNYRPYALAYMMSELLGRRQGLAGKARDDHDAKINALIASIERSSWSYNLPFTARLIFPKGSFQVALVMVSLAEARDQGFAVSAGLLKGSLDELETGRLSHGGFQYTLGSTFRDEKETEGDGAARSVLVEYLLFRERRSDQIRLLAAVERYLKYRDAIIARFPDDESNGFHKGPNSWANYYVLFGDYWSARALNELPRPAAELPARRLADGLLNMEQKPGFWEDHAVVGRSYGTAAAILALKLLLPLLS